MFEDLFSIAIQKFNEIDDKVDKVVFLPVAQEIKCLIC